MSYVRFGQPQKHNTSTTPKKNPQMSNGLIFRGGSGSKHSHMRELRVQSGGHPMRVFYAFDPRRSAILLIGGDKTGNDRVYRDYIPVADKLYDEHLEELRKEGLIP